MDSSEIYKALYRYYANYEYKLSNSYIYSWESDFFGMSKAGYFLEVEVKVSRNDYFRDFIKEKHRLFKACVSGESHYITSSSRQGDFIGSYVSGTLISQYGEYSRMSTIHPWAYESYKGKVGVWANDYGRVAIRHSEHDMYAPATGIHFHEVEKKSCPNQLYFACPTGLLRETEIPAYAGLLYCDGDSITMIKKAPYLHKRKPDMSRALLSKFYNLWTYNTTLERKLEVSAQQK